MRKQIKDVIQKAITYLITHTSLTKREAQQNATCLLAHTISKSASYLTLNYDATLLPRHLIRFKRYLYQLKTGKPLQYILGEWDFLGRTFLCKKNALIPRPETEQLVEWIIAFLQENKKVQQKIIAADVGTGSGVIAITLAIEFKNILITATDISQKALLLAKKNAVFHKVKRKIIFKQESLLSEEPPAHFDCIVANLPYIPSEKMNKLSDSVQLFEPHSALDGGRNGIALIKNLIAQSSKTLKSGGFIFLECSSKQRKLLEKYMELYHFKNIIYHLDYTKTISFIRAEKV
jgi:release factor glutamine methyltransferase